MGTASTPWRREVYGGLEAWVPADWGYGATYWPQRARRAPGPFVGRPGGVPLSSWNGVLALAERAFGDEALVLIIRGDGRAQEVFVRYSGCDGHGFDDGHTRRWLTADALQPLLTGPHRPVHGLQRVVAELIWPEMATS